MTAIASVTFASLWVGYAGKAASGRFPCPVGVIMPDGTTTDATHIYRGYGVIRLERITSALIAGRKGYQGEELASCPVTRLDTRLRIAD